MVPPLRLSAGCWLRRAAVAATASFAVALTGCVSAPVATPSNTPAADRLHQQAQAALARWAEAVAAAGGDQGIVIVGELTSQVGDWEPAVGDNNKRALMAGLVEATAGLPAATLGDGEVRWQDGTKQTVRLISAQQAVAEIRAGGGDCADCVPLRITAARLTSRQAETSRGPATVPTWEFTLQGTAVRATRVAIADRISVTPPPWNADDAPVGISIESASGTVGGRELTVGFVGAPLPGDHACGADYTAEAVESGLAIVVIVTAHPNSFPGACTSVGAGRTATARLAAPLGARTVLEVQQGLPVTVQLTR